MAEIPADNIVQSMDELDKLLEHRLRLTLCVLLSRYESLSFSKLKAMTEETDGNLGANLRKLEGSRYVKIRKSHVDRKPVTWYTMTARGQKALKSHLSALSALIGAAS